MKDDGVHTTCSKRLDKYGANAHCCNCIPHEDCNMDEVSKLSNDFGMPVMSLKPNIEPIQTMDVSALAVASKINELIEVLKAKGVL